MTDVPAGATLKLSNKHHAVSWSVSQSASQSTSGSILVGVPIGVPVGVLLGVAVAVKQCTAVSRLSVLVGVRQCLPRSVSRSALRIIHGVLILINAEAAQAADS